MVGGQVRVASWLVADASGNLVGDKRKRQIVVKHAQVQVQGAIWLVAANWLVADISAKLVRSRYK